MYALANLSAVASSDVMTSKWNIRPAAFTQVSNTLTVFMTPPLVSIPIYLTNLSLSVKPLLRRGARQSVPRPGLLRGRRIAPSALPCLNGGLPLQRSHAMTSRLTDVLRGALCCLCCLLYTSDAADERSSVDLGGRR